MGELGVACATIPRTSDWRSELISIKHRFKLGPFSFAHRDGKDFGFSLARFAMSERHHDVGSQFSDAGKYLDSCAVAVCQCHQAVGMIGGFVMQWRQSGPG